MRKYFKKKNRLGKETFHIIKKGKRYELNNIILYYLPDENWKISVVIGRKVGKSTVRNKLKRWTKETFRNFSNNIKNFGMVIIYKPDAANYNFYDIKEKLSFMWEKCGLIK